jgi:alpha-1,3-rhamnosyl/mannosyltransferase
MSMWSAKPHARVPKVVQGANRDVQRRQAMACGGPVVCSNLTSLPGVAADAAIQVDPTDDRALADAIYTAPTDQAARERLVEKGLARAASSTWEQTARRTLAVMIRAATQSDESVR